MMIYFNLFLTFLRIGLFTFGGGYAMLPMIREEAEAQGWLNQSELIDFIAVSESTPGPFAVNIATFVGARIGGVFGSLCATLGVALPCSAILSEIQKQQARQRRDERLETCCSRFDIGGAFVTFDYGILPRRIEYSSFRHSAVLRLARYIRCGNCTGVQKNQPDFDNTAVSRYRNYSRLCRNGLIPHRSCTEQKALQQKDIPKIN